MKGKVTTDTQNFNALDLKSSKMRWTDLTLMLLEELNACILRSCPGVDKPAVAKYYVSYKLDRGFTELYVQKGSIVVTLHNISYTDPRNWVTYLDSHGGPLKGRIRVRELKDISYAITLIEQLYNYLLNQAFKS